MELDRPQRIAYIKLVYCGPPGAGKSTNLRALNKALRPARRGPLETPVGGGSPTLHFEFDPPAPLRYGVFQIGFRVATVPGAASAAACKQLLQGADAVVFVADSSRARLHETMASFRDTTRAITAPRADATLVPLVLQYNRRDAADALQEAELEEALNPKRLLAAFPTIASSGEVFDTFAAALLGAMTMLAQRPESQALLGDQSAETWTEAAIADLFPPAPDAPTAVPVQLAREDTNPGRIFYEVASEPITRRLSVAQVEAALAALNTGTAADVANPSPPAAPAVPEVATATPPAAQPATPALATANTPESPAASPSPAPAPTPPAPPQDAPGAPASTPASTPASPAASPPSAVPAPPAPVAAPPTPVSTAAVSPAAAVDSARPARERDAARVERGTQRTRYEDLAAAVAAARAIQAGQAPAPVLHELLQRLAAACHARSASLLAPAAAGAVNVMAGLDAGGDPLAEAPRPGPLVASIVTGAAAPVVCDPGAQPALASALEAAGHSSAPVVLAPLRSARGLHAVLVLYLDAATPTPDPALLGHVATIADALALALARG